MIRDKESLPVDTDLMSKKIRLTSGGELDVRFVSSTSLKKCFPLLPLNLNSLAKHLSIKKFSHGFDELFGRKRFIQYYAILDLSSGI